MKLKGVFVAIF